VLEDENQTQIVIAVVPRFSYTFMGGGQQPPIGEVWEDLALNLPPGAPLEFENVFTGERVQANNGALLCRDIFSRFPVCVLRGMTASSAYTLS